jgi:hypothetical protein
MILYDPDRGYRGPREEYGMEFIVEHYTWRRLPKSVFDIIGGRDVAKTRRAELAAAKAAAERASAGAVTNGKVNENTGGESEDSVARTKRLLSSGFTNEENGSIKRGRTMSESNGESGDPVNSSSASKRPTYNARQPLTVLKKPVRAMIETSKPLTISSAVWIMLPGQEES